MARVNHGFHIFLDGNAYCAVGPHFLDLMKSPAGFGDTPQAAVTELHTKFKKDRWWNDKDLPPLEKFTIHSVDAHIGGREECSRYQNCEEGRCQCHCLDDLEDDQ